MVHTVPISDTLASSLAEWLHLVDLALPKGMTVGNHLALALHFAAQGFRSQDAADAIVARLSSR